MTEHAEDPSLDQSLDRALDRLWKQFLPQIEERVATLESAAGELGGQGLSTERLVAANDAAHKLAGVLGTFGLPGGTTLAREAEMLYSGDIDADSAARLIEIAAQLKSLVASRK